MIKEYIFDRFNAIDIKRIVGTGVEVDYLLLMDGEVIEREGMYTIEPFELTAEEIEKIEPKPTASID